ncbi:MAG TPA: hypothetical protein VGJ70_23645 [Solirubrobacteraceae bacterium]|jgi:hypothetical protein
MELYLALTALLCLVALAVTAPLTRPAAAAAEADDRRAELEAAKDAKYREIRDARLDFRLGKVSAADHEATERELQAQAVAILRELDDLR